jgi:AAA+ superfamily predicted ATPase
MSPKPEQPQLHTLTTAASSLQDNLRKYADLISEVIGVPPSEVTCLNLQNLSATLVEALVYCSFRGTLPPPAFLEKSEFGKLFAPRMADIKVHPGWVTAVGAVHSTFNRVVKVNLRNQSYVSGTNPISFTLDGVKCLVLEAVDYVDYHGDHISMDFFVFATKDVPAVLDTIEACFPRDEFDAILTTFVSGSRGSEDTIRKTSWEDVILSDDTQRYVRDDLRAFLNSKERFRKQRLPYKRGYLFHGEPGNGKTSAIRALICEHRLPAYTIKLNAPDMSDKAFGQAMRNIREDCPAFLILEDIDRAYPKDGERCKVSMDEMLNALDGVLDSDGLVVIATANNPEVLDPAILKRPGRFDRVIKFENPDRTLRIEYFLRRLPEMSQKQLKEIAEVTEGFSFAQLQEVYIAAGSVAYNNETEINFDLIIDSASSLSINGAKTGRKMYTKGFAVDQKSQLP